MSDRHSLQVRSILGALLTFGALNAFAGGWYGISGAPGVPVAWLAGSPFRSYVLPGLLLMVIVGGTLAWAAIAVFARWRVARLSALVAGIVVLLWIAVQVLIIGYVSWMQPATTVAGTLVIVLALILPRAHDSA